MAVETIKYKLEVPKEEFMKRHLKIISSLIETGLTKTEIEVLACFMSLSETVTEGYMFGTSARKAVMKKVNLEPAGLTNHLTSMLKKRVLHKDKATKIYSLNKHLIPHKGHQNYMLKLVSNEENSK